MPRALTSEEICDFRAELCTVATGLFAERGFDGVTLRGIAAELGCSPMTPYRYFENKAAIFHAVRTECFRRFGRRVERTAREHTDPIEKLRALMRSYIRFALDEPGSYRVMFQLDPPELPEDPEQEAVIRGTWAPLLGTVQEAVDAGRLSGDPLTLAHLCWVNAHGVVSLHLAGRLLFERSLDDLVDPLCDSLLQGTSPRPPQGASP